MSETHHMTPEEWADMPEAVQGLVAATGLTLEDFNAWADEVMAPGYVFPEILPPEPLDLPEPEYEISMIDMETGEATYRKRKPKKGKSA